jgi:hypothetical protein
MPSNKLPHAAQAAISRVKLLVRTMHQAMLLLAKEQPDNLTGIFGNFINFVQMASGTGVKISHKSSGWNLLLRDL